MRLHAWVFLCFLFPFFERAAPAFERRRFFKLYESRPVFASEEHGFSFFSIADSHGIFFVFSENLLIFLAFYGIIAV